MKRGSIDWARMRHDYIVSEETIKEMSVRTGVSVKSIGLRASAEGWVKQRQDYRDALAKGVTEEIRKEEVNRIRGWQTKVIEATDLTLEALLEKSYKAKDYPPTMMQAHIKSIEIAMKIAREMNGYISPVDQKKLDLLEQEFELKKKEFERNAEFAREPIVVSIEGGAERYSK